MSNLFKEGVAALLSELLQMIFMALLMFYINARLALLTLATMPLIVLLTYIFKEKIKHIFGRVRDAVSQLNSFVQEHLRGMSIVQIFGREAQELEQFEHLNALHRDASIKVGQYYAIYFPLLHLVNSASVSLLLWYGAKDVLQGTVSFGELVAFLMYINLFFRPLHLIADRFNTLQTGLVSLSRIVHLLENGAEVQNTGTHAPQQLEGQITFQNVSFSYEHGHEVLKDISFQLPAHQSLAIVGATGAGKSTLTKLLARFYDVDQGVISIDGINIQDYELRALRRRIGLVPQDVLLFSGSIYKNITLGDTSISRERAMEAARLVGMHDFIEQLPGGYDYDVREGGTTLSLGQRQLLSFARVLVNDPAIVILDEATASLDRSSEQLVQQALTTVMKGRTCVLIAHRLATIQHADKILVLKGGKIAEEGTHKTLMGRGGYYAALHNAS